MSEVARRMTGRYRQGPAVLEAGHLGWAIHHTVTTLPSSAYINDEIAHLDFIDRYHHDKRGFEVGLGYNAVVFESGRGYLIGEQLTQRAHVAGRNHELAGLAFVGTFTTGQPSPAALETARRIISGSPVPRIAGGHRDVALPRSPTTCPGNWDVLGLLVGAGPAPTPPPMNADVARAMRVLEDGADQLVELANEMRAVARKLR